VPDDAHSVVQLRDPEGAGVALAPDLRRGPGPVGAAVLLDGDVRDGLALPQRDLSVGAGEAPGEGERDLLLDPEGAVLGDLDPDVGLGEPERLRARLAGREERRERDRCEEGPSQNRT
jgi:hypothetical protein